MQRSLRRKEATLLSDPPRRLNVSSGVITQTLGAFELKVYRLTDV